jgi:hypothetical protein
MIVYKSAGDFVITLVIPYDAMTNIDREVYDMDYAKYRTNCALVNSIVHKKNFYEIDSIRSDFDKNFNYVKGEIIHCVDYDSDKDKVCAKGIHFYTTYDAAFHYSKRTKRWSDDGEPIPSYNWYNVTYH